MRAVHEAGYRNRKLPLLYVVSLPLASGPTSTAGLECLDEPAAGPEHAAAPTSMATARRLVKTYRLRSQHGTLAERVAPSWWVDPRNNHRAQAALTLVWRRLRCKESDDTRRPR